MRGTFRQGLALAAAALLLAGGCSDDEASTISGAGTPTSSAPTTVALSTTASTSAPTTTVPAGPAVAEAAGWRIAITAPTRGATIGPLLDLCYEATGPAGGAIAFEATLVLAATGTPASSVRVDATPGRGSARVNFGTPEPRRYDMTVQAIVNGQRPNGLVVTIGVLVGVAPPAGCP